MPREQLFIGQIGRPKCVQLLVSSGADVNAENIHGITLIDQARRLSAAISWQILIAADATKTNYNKLPYCERVPIMRLKHRYMQK